MQLTADYEKLPATPHSFISKEQGRKVVKRRENETLDVIKTLDRVYLGNQCETNCSATSTLSGAGVFHKIDSILSNKYYNNFLLPTVVWLSCPLLPIASNPWHFPFWIMSSVKPCFRPLFWSGSPGLYMRCSYIIH